MEDCTKAAYRTHFSQGSPIAMLALFIPSYATDDVVVDLRHRYEKFAAI